MSADVYAVLAELRRELTRCQSHVTELVNQLNALQLPSAPAHRCPTCGVPARGPLSLAEHEHLSHAGPVPPHWLEAERLAGFDAQETDNQ